MDVGLQNARPVGLENRVVLQHTTDLIVDIFRIAHLLANLLEEQVNLHSEDLSRLGP